ncbi:mitochondrial import receptor subunit Tom22 [Coemansia sp. RSA 1822]|nr:mitochondrial import receptor subunit Tom22 [Coemansia sp. RSA 638]KAJ2126112.1 mitochondrial import receptor subunit Tom22 [Coemansia sp. RSA 720]KAJ2566755.1 mitochondrial import receptor subunit Tom22 [Coemansia sp. RSA 1822]
MVKLVEIDETEYDSDSQYTTDSESEHDIHDDYVDSDFEDDYMDESLLERLAALKDIVPVEQRHALSKVASRVGYWGDFGMRLVGKLAWVFTTSAFLVVLPLAIETDREKMMMQWESEQNGAQGQAPPPGMAPNMAPGVVGPAPGIV